MAKHVQKNINHFKNELKMAYNELTFIKINGNVGCKIK